LKIEIDCNIKNDEKNYVGESFKKLCHSIVLRISIILVKNKNFKFKKFLLRSKKIREISIVLAFGRVKYAQHFLARCLLIYCSILFNFII